MRQLLDLLPGATVPDPRGEAELPGVPLVPPDDDDLIRPAAEDELFTVGEHGSLAGRANAPLAKHLLWTFGPWHRALPFMLQLRVELDGDKIVTVDPEIGWLHQGLEKQLETTTWEGAFDVLERLHPGRPEPALLAWALLVERLCGVEDRIPPRAQLWRTAMFEAARVLEHGRVLSSTLAGFAPRSTQRAFSAALRRLDNAVGALVEGDDPFRSIGGLARPVDDALVGPLAGAARATRAAGERLSHDLHARPEIGDALVGRGRVGRRAALSAGLTGPALRATGMADDVRVQDPAFAWPEHAHDPIVGEGGCALARARVRLEELIGSSTLVLELVDAIAGAPPSHRVEDGALPVRDGALAPPARVEVASVEAPGGELSLLCASDGGPRPTRARVRTPSFSLCAALPLFLEGARLDDVVPVLASLGLSGSEIDR